MQEDIQQFRGLFIQTSRESLDLLNKNLLVLEREPKNKEASEEISRQAHSLKGSSAMMKFESTAYLCHTIEDVFYEVKEGQLKLSGSLVDEFFSAFDFLSKEIDAIEETGNEINAEKIIARLKKLTGVKTQGTGKSVRTRKPVSRVKKTKSEDPKSTEVVLPEVSQIPLPKTTVRTVPVKADQLDAILDLMGEILVQRLALRNVISELGHEGLKSVVDRMELGLDDLQYRLMKARMLPIKNAFSYLPRAVRDFARKLEKDIELVVEGEDLELDRNIVEKLDEPLIHIIRNAVDHGIEKKGVIKITAEKEGDLAVVTVSDNGRGIDWVKISKKSGANLGDKQNLLRALFSGISTAEAVTEVSGRGVGLMSVKKMTDELNGSVDVKSEPGIGTTFIMKFPLTLAVVSGLLVEVGQNSYIVPSSIVDRSLTVESSRIKRVLDQEIFLLDETDIPLIRLHQKFGLFDSNSDVQKEFQVVIVRAAGGRIGMTVDRIVSVSDMIIKPVPAFIRDSRTFIGSSILGNGKTVLILNPEGLI